MRYIPLPIAALVLAASAAEAGDSTTVMTPEVAEEARWVLLGTQYVANGDRVAKPNCAGTGRIILQPVKDNGAFRAWAQDQGGAWEVRLVSYGTNKKPPKNRYYGTRALASVYCDH